MTQPINPYAPTLTTAPAESRNALINSDAQTVSFRTTISDETWRQIRELPAISLTYLIGSVAATLIGLAIGVVTWNWEPISQYATPLLLAGWTIFITGLGLCVVLLQRQRDAGSIAQTETLAWLRGNVHGKFSSQQLTLHTDTVSVAIPRECIRKLQWYSGALQIEFGPSRIPAVPAERLSIPIDAFEHGNAAEIPLVPAKPNLEGVLVDERWQETMQAISDRFAPQVSGYDWRIDLSDHLKWNDVEWTEHRTFLRRSIQFSCAISLAIFCAIQIVSESSRTLLHSSIFATVLLVGYMSFYSDQLLAGRTLFPIQGWIAGRHDRSDIMICLRGFRFVAVYQGRPTRYGRWTKHGLEIRPEPERLAFFVPARAFDSGQTETMRKMFPGDAIEDTMPEQHWPGPTIPSFTNPAV